MCYMLKWNTEPLSLNWELKLLVHNRTVQRILEIWASKISVGTIPILESEFESKMGFFLNGWKRFLGWNWNRTAVIGIGIEDAGIVPSLLKVSHLTKD